MSNSIDIIQLIVDYISLKYHQDANVLNAIWQLSDRLMNSVSPNIKRSIQRNPQKSYEVIGLELKNLIHSDPVSKSLVQYIINIYIQKNTLEIQPISGFNVTGDNNQVAHAGKNSTINQSMNISALQSAPEKSQKSVPLSSTDHARQLISVYTQRLQLLEQRAAREGLHTAPEVKIEIDELKAEIERLEAQLRDLR